MPRTAKDKPAADRLELDEERRARLLERYGREPSTADDIGDDRPLTDEEVVLGLVLRERDHLEGCPLIGNPRAGVHAEAYDTVAVAPQNDMKNLGVRPGDHVTTVRCRRCAGSRYLRGTVRELMLAHAGAADPTDPLDDTL